MDNTLSRIKIFIDFKGITIKQFERELGFSNASISNQYKNNGAIGSDKVEKILQFFPELSPIWLLKGEGDMIIPNSGGIQDDNSIQNTGTMANSYVGSGNFINVALPEKGTQKIIKPDGTVEVFTSNPYTSSGIVAEDSPVYIKDASNLQEQIQLFKGQIDAYKNIIEEQKEIIRLLKDNKD